ncbi:MAG: aldehyde ferredoxin oxidoreductase family protein [Candidatus Bathyarchaeia archaeon]
MSEPANQTILRVDLTRKTIRKEPVEKELLKLFLGGPGVAAKILYDEVDHWVDAFDPLNRLIMIPGSLTGTLVPCVGRHFIITKSPLTGYFAEANAGGFWGAELKFAGYDFLIVTGRSEKPAYISIQDETVSILNASDYWGLNARDADRAIRRDLGDEKIKVADIGQAGENLVRIAGIMNDEANRAAARCGVGAVMGSKNLKAVAVRGHGVVPVADSGRLRNEVMKLNSELAKDESTQHFHKYGTAGGIEPCVVLGDAPVANWTKNSQFKEADQLNLPGGYSEISIGIRSCHNCSVSCRRVVSVRNGSYATEEKVEGPEYESVASLGSMCMVSDIKAVGKANDLCNTYGLDTISTGSVIAFAMECFEKGKITADDTDGMTLRFGDGEALVALVRKIALREGFGNVLAEGVRRAAATIGKETEKFAIHVKGLELGMHDPRANQAMSLTYACSPTGGRHMEGETLWVETPAFPVPELNLEGLDRLSTERKPEAAFKVQNLWMALSAAGYCLLACATGTTKPYTITRNIELYNIATGTQISFDEFMKAGERIFNVRRAFTMRHGARRSEDTLPERLLKEPIPAGPSRGSVARLDEMLPKFYEMRGWDPVSGKPLKQKLLELGLEDVAEDLYDDYQYKQSTR